MAAAAMSLQCATAPVTTAAAKESVRCRRSQAQPWGCSEAVALRGRPLRAAPLASPARGAGVLLKGTKDASTGPRRDCACMAFEAGVGIYGRKEGMTQMFNDEGNLIPCTVISTKDGNVVTEIKTQERDGYDAVQVGYEVSKDKHLTKPQLGHLRKNSLPNLRRLGEFRVKSTEGYEIGQKLEVTDVCPVGSLVDIRGKSSGKGFQGTTKRHGFARGPMTHGSKSHRQPGSIGMSATPSRILPGKKMPGQMGNTMVKARKIEVIHIDEELGALLVRGSVPGKPGALLRIAPAKIVGKNV